MSDLKERGDQDCSPDVSSLDKNPSVQHIEHPELQHAVGVEGAKVVKEAGNGRGFLSNIAMLGLRYSILHSAEFAAAQIAGKLDPRSKESLTIYACAAVTFLCSCV